MLEKWLSPPVTRSIAASAPIASTGTAHAMTIARRDGPPGSASDGRGGAGGADRDHAADVGAEAAGARPPRRAASIEPPNSAASRTERAAVPTAAAIPTSSSTGRIASSSLPIP